MAAIQCDTTEARRIIGRQVITEDQIESVMDDAQERGQVTFKSPVHGAMVTVIADDDAQTWIIYI